MSESDERTASVAPIRWRDALITRTALAMALRVTVVVMAVTALSYWHLVQVLTDQTQDKLRQYVQERAERESAFLSLAEEYQRVFKREFLQAWPRMDQASLAAFDTLYQSLADGTTRLRPEFFYGSPAANGTQHRNVTGFIGRGVAVDDPVLRKRLVLMWQLVDRFGPAWTTRFANLYAFGPENLLIGHWDGLPWGLDADPALDMTQEAWSLIVDPVNNPDGHSAWTDLYYDKTADLWMVTAVTPIDADGRRLGSAALDVGLNDLFKRVSEQKLAGTYNLIVSANGGLVIHPGKLDVLKAKTGQVRIDALQDAKLNALFQRVSQAAPKPGQSLLLDDANNDAFLAVAPLQGPNWWFITVYPKALLTSAAVSTAQFILLLSVISLVIELLMLYLVMHRQVVQPLQVFVHASHRLATGDYDAVASGRLVLPESRGDEVGVLARAFRDMTQRIVDFRDTLERKVAQRTQELVVATDEARSANAAKSRFLAHMSHSHEIRTPMNAVIGMSRLILNTPLNRKQQDYVDKIHGAAKALLGIINDILDYSKVEAGRLSLEQVAFDLNDVAKSVSGVTCLQAQSKGLELLLDIAKDVPRRLLGDPLRLSQVLINLTSNAIKFTEHGEVVVRIEHGATLGEQVDLQFQVRDSGIGIPPERISALFRPFTQVDDSITRRFGGTGLGLAISQQIVELMGGRIEVSSTLGQGSCFSFRARFGRLPGDPIETPREQLRKQYALVVDDNHSARIVLSEMLAQMGVRADTAVSGEDALIKVRRAQAQQDPYSLILIDWNMPGIDGIETARLVRDMVGPESPLALLMVTAYDHQGLAEQASQAGVVQVLSKPLNESALHDALLESVLSTAALAEQRGQRQQSAAVAAQRQALQDARVLLADDSPLNQQVVTEFLADVGIVPEVVANGCEAVAAVQAGNFELVLMDIEMPEMDGLSATRLLRQQPRFADLPIIAMTAHVTDEIHAQALAAGVNDRIVKPIDPQQMYATLIHWLRRPEAAASPATGSTLSPDPSALEIPANFHLLAEGGLDVANGLRRHLHRPALYTRILLSFTKEFSGAEARLRADLAAGRREELLRLAHTLKSSSSGIGALALAQSARALETACQQGLPEPALVEECIAALRPLLALLAQWQPLQSLDVTSPSGESLDEVYAQLEHCLREDDARAADWLAPLAARLPASASALLAELHVAIEDLEHTHALELLARLRAIRS